MELEFWGRLKFVFIILYIMDGFKEISKSADNKFKADGHVIGWHFNQSVKKSETEPSA